MKIHHLTLISCLLIAGTANAAAIAATDQYSAKHQCPQQLPQFSKKDGIIALQSWGQDLEYYYDLYRKDQFKIDKSPAEFTAYHYTSNAVLMPTLNSKTRIGIQEVHDYFDIFMLREPHLLLTESNIAQAVVTLAGCGYGNMSGYYSFNSKGKILKARYTMQFKYIPAITAVNIDTNDGYILTVKQQPGWYIAAHHSSLLPAP